MSDHKSPKLDAQIDVSEDDVKRALERPRDFGYHGDRDDMFVTWALGSVVLSRDSDLLETANHEALIKHLESDPTLADDWERTTCNHWAVGWVEHLSFRAVEDDKTTPTRIFRVLAEWFAKLSDYPVADEALYSDLEHKATLENIEQAGRRFVKDGAPEDWAAQCLRWFYDNDEDAVESRDDRGGYPSDEQIKTALSALDLLEDE